MAIRDIEREMDRFFEKVNEQLHRVDQYVGESFVRKARQIDTYKDDTGNLRNSIGYIAESPVGTVKAFDGRYTKKTSAHGQQEGALYAEGLRSEIKDSGLILVAGMDYAYHVEAGGKTRGKKGTMRQAHDVISNSVEIAKKQHFDLRLKVLSRLAK